MTSAAAPGRSGQSTLQQDLGEHNSKYLEYLREHNSKYLEYLREHNSRDSQNILLIYT